MACAALAAAPARAEVVWWEYTGLVTAFADPEGHLPGVNVGSPFWGRIALDRSVPDVLPGDPTVGLYHEAIQEALVVLPGYSGTGPLGLTNVVHVSNGYLGGDYFNAQTDITAGSLDLAFELRLSDPTASVFDTDGLPAEPPALGDLSYARLVLYSQTANINLTGALSTLQLVPEPASLLLAALAVLLLGRAGARCR